MNFHDASLSPLCAAQLNFIEPRPGGAKTWYLPVSAK